MQNILKLLATFDRWANDKLLKGRWETISGRCYRRTAKGCRFCSWLCRALNKIDPNHCRKAYFSDRVYNPNLPWI